MEAAVYTDLPPILASGGLDTKGAPIDPASAREIARQLYGLSGAFKRFSTEKDDTFLVTPNSGRPVILKISNPSESVEEIDLQVAALDHIAAEAPTLPVPRVIRDVNGAATSINHDADGLARIVRVMSYLDGTVLDTTDTSPKERERIGEMLAQLRLAMAGFTHPAAQRDLAWDVKHLGAMRSLLRHVDDKDHRSALAAGLDRFEAVTARLPQLRSQVLHNDFSRSNIVVDHTDPDFVRGIIDFGDTVHTAIAIDVSTALLNQLPSQPTGDALARGRDLVRGYLRKADLTEEELMLVPHLTMGRVILRALLTTWRAKIMPGNSTYILRNTPQGWWQLKWFLDKSVNEVSQALL